jgi:hypothetical protein
MKKEITTQEKKDIKFVLEILLSTIESGTKRLKKMGPYRSNRIGPTPQMNLGVGLVNSKTKYEKQTKDYKDKYGIEFPDLNKRYNKLK